MKIKWGVLGCGDIAQRMGIPAIVKAEGSDLMAVMDIDQVRANEIASQFGAKESYGDINDLLNNEEINAIYIATPPALHCKQTHSAANAGKHVLCEKPMAMSERECESMVQVCKENGVILGVAYYRRFYPKIQFIKTVLDSGQIGKPTFARCQTSVLYNPSNLDDPKEWRATKSLGGGGCLIEIGSHRLDLLVYLLGNPVQVTAFTSNKAFSYQVEDSAYLIIEFINDAYALASFNWNMALKSDEFEIHGTLGKIIASPLDSESLFVLSDGEMKEYNLPRNDMTHLPLIENFIGSINNKDKLLVPGKEAAKASNIIDAAYTAAKMGLSTISTTR
jgi:predicted dehydrogenase